MSHELVGFSEAALEVPRELIGDGLTSRRCTDMNDPLMLQSLILEHEGQRAAIITVDLLAIDFEEADEIRHRLATLGFDPANIMIAASHTHSGPPSIDFGFVKKSKELGTELIEKAVQSARQAVERLSRVSVRAGSTEFPHNANRRQRNWLGRTTLGVNLDGPVDHQLNYLLFETANGRILLLCYGCHPVINKKTFVASADYVYGIRDAARLAGIKTAMFLNGALGDVNPYDRERNLPLGGTGVKEALDFGSRMTGEVLTSLATRSRNSNLRLASTSAALEVILPKLEGGAVNRKLLVQAFAVAGSVLVAFPGEIFAETGLALRKRSLTDSLAVVSCANGYVGYLAPEAEYARPGYEVKYSPRVFGYRVPRGTAEAFQGVGARLIEEVVGHRYPVSY